MQKINQNNKNPFIINQAVYTLTQ